MTSILSKIQELGEIQSAVWARTLARLAIARQHDSGYAVGYKLRVKFPDDYAWRIAATPEGKHGVHVRVYNHRGVLTYEEHIARRGFPQRNLIRRLWMVL